ncbi:MAG: DUF1844 domain-containing protein [Candidatus Krumholzibacteria bacterium]|nr:DUF1844 domain-containing protein [Candidatus Krumholzibacteria bacterium]MDH4336339.1 DUF1844 domain-containing protein [Candidatus Krumholzibacteria bacterium]MDH5270511.1 DUF1844 domain-containing protein [Candidatus Krumholzibacteria bacterium]MDH5627209.1 DUF1844 domain-containing protein [Candidatus Krumholzibacteria bacterium]
MPDASRDEILFVQLVATFQFAAMQQMGKIANPVSGEIERDLEQARTSIDIVQMLQRKTEGHRSARESEFLDKVLFELQMNYVDETRRGEGEEKASGEGNPEN